MNHLYVTIFFVSLSILIFEVSLTRLFSIYLSYHFAFMIVSIAMLGIGSAGTILSLLPFKPSKNIENRLSIYSFITGITIIISYLISNHIPFDTIKLSWEKRQVIYLALYCFVLSTPFFFSGLLIATAFSVLSKDANSIYASDLIGAGLGSLTVIILLNTIGPEFAIIFASIICLLSSMIAINRLRVIPLILILVNSYLLIIHPPFIDVRLSPYKPLSLALKYPHSEHIRTYNSSIGRIDILRSPMIRFAPGLSLKYLEPLPEQIGISIDGSELYAVTRAEDKKELNFLSSLPSALVYELGGKERALILEPKGGLHVLMASFYGVKDIQKIESNPLLIKVIKEDLDRFSGGIFKENTWSGLGRNLIKRLKDDYDIIDLSIIGTSISGMFGTMEDYRFTTEAFREYIGALRGDGILSISLYLIPPPRREFRILTTAIKALEDMGIKETWRNMVAIRSWDTMTILIKKMPFTEKEIDTTKRFIRRGGFDFLYYPNIRDEDIGIYIKTSNDEYYRGFKTIINPAERERFIKDYIFDIRPMHDETPFFHYYMKFKNIKVIYKVIGQKLLYFIEEGYILPLIFIILLILSVVMILLPLLPKTPLERFKRLERFKLLSILIYFSMLGLGFMFVEVTLIQRCILVLENPAYSLSIVLTTILISSGTGSVLSMRFNRQDSLLIPFLISCLILVYSLIQPLLFNHIVQYPIIIRAFIVSLSIIPAGLLMGIPFPLGIKLIGRRSSSLIPWAWATNSFFSVLAPVMTIMLAVTFGFRTVLWFGALAYLLACGALRKLLA